MKTLPPPSSLHHRPRVMINMAMSLDGKVSSAAREPVTFTSREDRALLFRIRAQADALVVGARTAATDCITMGIPLPRLRQERLRRGQSEQPVRVIVSARLTLPRRLPVFRATISPLVIACCESAPHERRSYFARHGRLLVCGRRELHVCRLLEFLASEYHCRTVLCEGGPTLNDAFFRAGSVDDLYVTLCPRVIGGRDAPTLVDGTGFGSLAAAATGRLVACRRGNSEWFLHYRFRTEPRA